MCKHCRRTIIEFINIPYWWVQKYGAQEAIILHELWEQSKRDDFTEFDLEAIKRLINVKEEVLFQCLQNLGVKGALSFEEETWHITLVD